MNQQELHKLIVGTRNAIARRGHTKGTLEDDAGRVCLYGGACLFLHGTPHYETTDRWDQWLEKLAAALGFAHPVSAVRWNNDPAVTQEDVLARLDKAAAETAPLPSDPLDGLETVTLETEALEAYA